MNGMKFINVVIGLAFISIGSIAYAEDVVSSQHFCNESIVLTSENDLLKKLSVEARKFRAKYCKLKIGLSKDIMSDYRGFLMQAKTAFPNVKDCDYSPIHQELISWDHQVKMKVRRRSNIYYFYVGNDEKCSQEKNKETAKWKELKDFSAIYNYVVNTQAKKKVVRTYQQLVELDARWEDYFKHSRSQTGIELLVNTCFYNSDKKQSNFGSPPEWQVTLLHPSIVVENIRDTLDGTKTKEALMLELIGVNYWKNRDWYIPTGVSIVGTYSDRPLIKKWGLGGVIHFNQKFSIGYTRYGKNHDGFFISMDFLKFVEDKKEVFETYSEKINEIADKLENQ